MSTEYICWGWTHEAFLALFLCCMEVCGAPRSARIWSSSFFFAFHSYNILCNNKFYCSSCSMTCSREQCCTLDTWHIQHMNAVMFDSRAFCCRRASLHPQANKLLPHSWGGFGVPYGDTASKSVWQRRRPGKPAILVNATGRNPGRRTRTTTMKRCWVTQFFITDTIFILSTQMAHWLLPTL